MAIHKPFDRPFFTLGGSTMSNGFSLNLAEGQFGIFNVSKQTPKGAVAVDSFKGYGKDTLFELRLGNKQKMTRTTSNKMYSSFPFKITDVVDLHVSAPKRTTMGVDEVIIGYNGIDPSTSLEMFYGENKELHFEFEGKALEYLGIPEGIATVIVPLMPEMQGKVCSGEEDFCEKVDFLPVLNYAIQYLKDYEFRGRVKLTDYVEISPIIELDGVKRTGELVQVTYNMSVCDTGDAGALALVQQQYPDVSISFKSRKGAITTYEAVLMQEVGGTAPTTPVSYSQTLPSLIKGCQDCPTGYDEVEGGFIYAVLIEDDGANASTAVQAMANAVAGTAIKADGQSSGKGMYTVVLTGKLSDADFNTFITANPTSTINFVGEVASICNNDTITTAAWTEVGRCTYSTEPYTIILPDNECGESRLAELQAFYPNLNIVKTALTGACQSQYSTAMPTNVVCEDDCSPIFQDMFNSEEPESFDGVKWKKTEVAVDGSEGKYGIRLKGKVFKVATGEALRDQLGYIEDSIKIKATGGYITDFNYSTTGGRVQDRPFAVSYISHYTPRTHVSGNMLDEEERAKTYFTGRLFNHDYLGRILTGNESNLIDLDAQLVDYGVTLRRSIYSQGMSQRSEENITYHILAEVGRHETVETILNALAAGAGIEGVQAFPKV